MQAKPEQQHEWLKQLVGEWTYEIDAPGPDGKPMKLTGTESVRMFGDLWLIAHGRGTMPDGSPAETQLTIGYDPAKACFVGTWFGTMMTMLWTYEGQLDESKKSLTLESTGPTMTPEGGTTRYRDTITLISPTERTFDSTVEGKDGTWTPMMSMTHRRKL